MAVINIFNKREAFKKMAETKEFKLWHKAETARRLGFIHSVDDEVNKMMKPENLKVEYL